MKTRQLISSVLVAVSLVVATTVFAGEVQAKQTNYPVSLNVVESIKSNKPYQATVKLVDKYGNLVSAEGKYEQKFYWMASESDTTGVDGSPRQLSRTGYKPSHFVPSGHNSQIITLEPSAIAQVTMGKVLLLERTPKDNWWISLTKPGEHVEDVVIKVKEDGTFKFLNLENGTYDVELFRGTPVSGYSQALSGCIWDKTHIANRETWKIKGNINKTVDATKSVVDAVELGEYFNDGINYSTPEKYLNITSHIELDDATKAMADKKFNDKKDNTTVREILSYMLGEYHDFPEEVKTALNLPAKDVIAQGYATGCTQFGTVFQALCEYKGIPTVTVECVQVEWMEDIEKTGVMDGITGHAYVECYVNGKWILVDPTGCLIYENYDMTSSQVYHMTNDDLRFYPIAKADDNSCFDLDTLLGVKSEFGLSNQGQEVNKLAKLASTERVR